MVLKLVLQKYNDVYKYKISPFYAKLFQNTQRDVYKNSANGQFDRCGCEGVKTVLLFKKCLPSSKRTGTVYFFFLK